jgi:hypothetical protein
MKAAAAVAILVLAAPLAFAAPKRLDDRASPRSQVNVESRWLHSGEGLNAEQLNAMVATIANLEFRLDTSAYVGKRARIYLVIPEFVQGLRGPGGMRVEWTTRGQFMSGAALPGQRTLVYDGPIQRPSMQESLDLSVYLDARYLERGLRFDPAFEIDVAP